MKNLKSALGKEEEQTTTNKFSQSHRVLRNNNSESMWTIGDGLEDDDNTPSLNSVKFVQEIIEILRKNIKQQGQTQASIPLIVNIYQKLYGSSHKEKEVLENIQRIVKKMLLRNTDIQSQLEQLSETLKKRIKKLKKKEQRKAMEFDEIAQKMFKKPQQNKKLKENNKKVLEINLQSEFQTKPRKKVNKNHDSNGNSNGTKNSGSGSQDSGQNKLGKLLSSGSMQRQKNTVNNQEYTAEGYNFSALMSASLAVKQRNPKNQDLDERAFKAQKKIVHKKDQSSEGDDAFIFYRPTKGKK